MQKPIARPFPALASTLALTAAAAGLLASILLVVAPDARSQQQLHGRAWDYNVRGSNAAASRAAMMFHAERVDDQAAAAALAAQGGAAGAGAGNGAGGFGSTANYSIITVIVDDGSTGKVNIESAQDSEGNQSAQTVTVLEQNGDTFSAGAAP